MSLKYCPRLLEGGNFLLLFKQQSETVLTSMFPGHGYPPPMRWDVLPQDSDVAVLKYLHLYALLLRRYENWLLSVRAYIICIQNSQCCSTVCSVFKQ